MRLNLCLFLTALILTGCITDDQAFAPLPAPEEWAQEESQNVDTVDPSNLKAWWKLFNDPALDNVITAALGNSPDRKIAEARLIEAQGVRRTTDASLLPNIAAAARAGKGEAAFTGGGESYSATVNSNLEINFFGRNRRIDAAHSLVTAAEAGMDDATLTLVAQSARLYIAYRAYEKQALIAQKNLETQNKTLELTQNQFNLGEAPRIDVERAQNLVSTSQAQISEFERLSTEARLQLTILTGLLSADIRPVLSAGPVNIPKGDIRPVLAEPAMVLALRPDVRAAAANFQAQTELAESVTADLFPTFNLSAFFGVEKIVASTPIQIWDVTLGMAATLLDFGRIGGRIDSARAREAQAYELLRKTILGAVVEVETALSDYASTNRQLASLQQGQLSAQKTLEISQQLYDVGEISFLDFLDSQRTANAADAALVSAEAAQAQALVSLYEALGVY